jgi:HEPN domain-containing protein
MDTQNPNLAPRIMESLAHLFYVYSPAEISHYIRKLLVCFAINEKDVPEYHDDLVNTMDLLMDFLEVADDCGVHTDTNKAHLRKLAMDVKEENNGFSGSDVEGPIEEVKTFLVQLIQPEKIFCVQVKDSIDQCDLPCYDFLIIVPDSSQIPFKNYETLIDLVHIKNAKVSFTVHKASTIYKQIEDGHLFYSAICLAENLIYDGNSSKLPTVDTTTLVAAKLKAQREFGISYEKALAFFNGAKIYIDLGNSSMAAFMLQQTIELALRGLVKSYLGIDIRTHSIFSLLKNLRGFFPELTLLFRSSTLEEVHSLELLERAYLSSRYDVLEISNEHLHLATYKAERMLLLMQDNFI